jgi:hypothetical protein
MRNRLGWAAGATAVATAAAAFVLPGVGGAATVHALRTSVHVDFGTRHGAPAHGYTADYGLAYAGARGYGWTRVSNGKPVALVGNGVRRTTPKDPRYQSFLQMQAPHGPVKTPAQWQVALVDGLYDVTVAVGDSSATDSFDVITAEPHTARQVVLVGGFKPSASHRFYTVTKRVRVTGHRLGLNPAGGRNTKIDFVVAVPVRPGSPVVTPKPPTTTPPTTATPTTATPTTAPTTTSPTTPQPGGFVDDFTKGGTVGAGCQVTGLDGVLPNTAGNQCLLGNIAFVPGAGLRLTSTAGQLADDNQQNALYKTFDASSGSFTVTARVVGPVSQLTQNYQQIGAWFGPDQDNFVKVEAEHNGTGAPHLTMFDRHNGAPGRIVTTISLQALTTAITLDLVIKGANHQLTVFYRLNGGALVQVGTAELAADVSGWFTSTAKAGILDSNSGSTTSVVATFSSFSIASS